MRAFFLSVFFALIAATGIAAELAPRDLVAQLYQAQKSKHNPLAETRLLGQYFDAPLLKLYQRDEREAKGEVGRLDGDPLYDAQDLEITDFNISPAETAGAETNVTVRFQNMHKPHHIVYLLTHTPEGWRISDIRYDRGSSLKKILQADL